MTRATLPPRPGKPKRIGRTPKGQVEIMYGMPAELYHGDPAPEPSLSASLAKVVIEESERHAWEQHPRLNPDWTAKAPSQEMEDGTALHVLVLGAGTEIVRVGAKDWKEEWAREKRDRARRDGKVPVLKHRIPELYDCAQAVRAQLEAMPKCADLFGPGHAEVVLVGRIGPGRCWCRTRIDWLPTDPNGWIYDFKFTTKSAAPQAWERKLWDEYAIQTAMITGMVHEARGIRPPGVRYVCAEMHKPWGVSVLTSAPDTVAYGESLLSQAQNRWSAAMSQQQWRGYSTDIGEVQLPGWKLAEFELELALAENDRPFPPGAVL